MSFKCSITNQNHKSILYKTEKKDKKQNETHIRENWGKRSEEKGCQIVYHWGGNERFSIFRAILFIKAQ